MIAEEEISKLINLMILLMKKQGVKVDEDPELKRLLGTSNAQIEKQVEAELSPHLNKTQN